MTLSRLLLSSGLKYGGDKCPLAGRVPPRRQEPLTDHRSAGRAAVEFVTSRPQQINDNYPSDTSTVITLQDQAQGERELERMKGCGPR